MKLWFAIGAAAWVVIGPAAAQTSSDPRASDKPGAMEERGVRTIQDAIAALERDQRRGARVPVPQTDIAKWFGADAYPAEAQRAGEQGRVVAQLTVASDGRVSACDVSTSSGSTSLDRRTCEIALTRLSFRAPRDRRGRALASNYLLPVRWVLPGSAPGAPLEAYLASEFEGDATLEFTVDPQGKLLTCRMSGRLPSGRPDGCATHPPGEQISAPWRRDGRPVGAKITVRSVRTVSVEP